MIKKLHLWFIAISAQFIASYYAVGSCGAANCPLNTNRYLQAGWLSIGFGREYINQDQIFIGRSKSFVGAIRGDHDEVQTLNERSVFDMQIGVLNQLGINITVPFIHREHIHIAHEASGDAWESWNFSGLGDITITGQYAFISPMEEFEPFVSIMGGVKLASGVTDERDGEGELAEVTIQPGTGSTDGIIGINYRQTLFSVPTFSGTYSAFPVIFGLTYQFNGTGTDGYKFGNTFLLHVGTQYQFAKKMSVLFQANGRFQDFADVGQTGEPRENTGGTWIYLSPGLGIHFTDTFHSNAYIQLPVYQNVHGIQQASAYNLFLHLSYDMNMFGDE